MKNVKTILALLMTAALVLSFAAIPAFADAESDLEYIMNKGTLVVGFDDAFPPFSYQADDGTYDGFDLACAKDLAERWGLEIVYQPVAWASKEQELNGSITKSVGFGIAVIGSAAGVK